MEKENNKELIIETQIPIDSGAITKNSSNTTSKEDKYKLYRNAKETEPFLINGDSLVKFYRSFTYLGSATNLELNDTEDTKTKVKKGFKSNESP